MVVERYMNSFSTSYANFSHAINVGDIKVDNSQISFPTGKAKLAERMAARNISEERKLSPLEIRSIQDLCKVVDRILDWVYTKIFSDYSQAKKVLEINYSSYIIQKRIAEVPKKVVDAMEKKADELTDKVANTAGNVKDKVFGFAKSIINPKKVEPTAA